MTSNFINPVNVFARRAGSNVVIKCEFDSKLDKVMRRYFEMDFDSKWVNKKGEYHRVYSYHGSDDIKMVKQLNIYEWVIIDGCHDNSVVLADKVYESELAKLPQDGTFYYI